MSEVMAVRTAARAVIIQEGRILLIEMRRREGIFFVLPGGGQKAGETLVQALQREVKEETGYRIEIGRLLYLREYIGRHHHFNPRHRNFHQLEAVFSANLVLNQVAAKASNQDPRQSGLRWVPLAELPNLPFYPEALRGFLSQGEYPESARYLGDIN